MHANFDLFVIFLNLGSIKCIYFRTVSTNDYNILKCKTLQVKAAKLIMLPTLRTKIVWMKKFLFGPSNIWWLRSAFSDDFCVFYNKTFLRRIIFGGRKAPLVMISAFSILKLFRAIAYLVAGKCLL